jgi:hypothetical protein
MGSTSQPISARRAACGNAASNVQKLPHTAKATRRGSFV